MSRFASSRIAAVIAVLLASGHPLARQGVPARPTAVNDVYTTAFNTPLTVTAPGVLANDVTNGGGTMTAVTMASGEGSLQLNSDGSFTYTPSSYFTGPDLFLYRAVNTLGMGNTASITITVAPPAGVPLPLALDDRYTVGANGTLTVEEPGVMANDDPRSTFSTVPELLTQPAHGSLSWRSDGFTYIPFPGFSGDDTATYRLRNVAGPGAPATVTFTVLPAGVPVPVANFRIVGMTGNAVTFAWTPPTSGPAATGFRLDGGIAAGATIGTIPLGTAPRATVTLPTGSFYVRARTLAGALASPPSNEVRVHVNASVPPSAPTNLIGGATWNTLNLAWLPGFAGGPPTGAVLEVSGSAAAAIPLGPGDTYTLDNVPPGTYTLALRQTGPGGASARSAPVTLTFPSGCLGAELPRTPHNVQAYKLGGTLHVHWEPATGGPAAAAYRLQVYDPFTGSLPVAGRSFSTTPPPGVYQFAVVAVNACGESPASTAQTVTFP